MIDKTDENYNTWLAGYRSNKKNGPPESPFSPPDSVLARTWMYGWVQAQAEKQLNK